MHLLDNALGFLRNLWGSFGGLPERRRAKQPYVGFRAARTGRHKDTRLTRHEQTRNPAGSKLWKACPIKLPCWETGR